MRSALEFAEVRTFSGRGGDIAGLLSWLLPDLVVVDTRECAVEAAAFADEHKLPVLYLSVRDRTLRLYRAGAWEQVDDGEGPTIEAIRNIAAGALFARGGPVR